jgi:hypothetical protein
MIFKKSLPWWFRLLAKILLSRLPLGYWFWKSLGLFEHGNMNHPIRALDNYLLHVHTANFSITNKNFSLLELGPGDSVFTAMIAKAHGASRVWLIDVGRFATTDPAAYTGMAAYLYSKKYYLPFKSNFTNFNEVLSSCNAFYLTNGIESLAQIPDHSVDFCFSNSVLAQIPKRNFNQFMLEIRRVLKLDGVSIHWVDLKDHMGGALNNLRFSEAIWEGSFFSRSGFYTNRIRYSEMLDIFDEVGFNCEVPRKVTWDKLPIARSSLAERFQNLSDDDLMISGFHVVLRPKGNS